MNHKPRYQKNLAHSGGHPGFGRHKTPEPIDASEVYDTAIWDEKLDTSNSAKRTYWGLNKSGVLYRFTGLTEGNMAVHFNGLYDPASTRKDKETNLNIRLNDIPVNIKRKFNIKG